ncbi:MAG: efflux RND transporter permease subunit [Bacteroidales bacterium]|nr:efflux RND transporter permease subunit [Bacteroidales bacterium]
MENNNEKIRDFKLTVFSLKNKTTIFILTLLIIISGWMAYVNMPKELFPEVNFPFIMVQTIYPGNAPTDIENLITRPIEKEIDGLKGIKTISSTSMQDVSMISIEFTFETDLQEALNDVKDAVDKSKINLPDDLDNDPVVKDIDLSEFPIINVNLYGDFSLDELKKYADKLDDRFATIPEVSKVNIQGINDKEIQINTNYAKMEARQVSFRDIQNAIAQENHSLSAGNLKINGTQRTIRIDGEFKSIDDIRNVIVKHQKRNIVYLKDIAEVKETYADPNSITRLNGKPVLSLQVVKKSGKNLLSATEQIYKVIDVAKANNLIPQNLHISTTNDQSDLVKKQLNNLENSMIMSILFVVFVLFLFLGLRNAIFVGTAIPLSMFLSFAVLGWMGEKINMIVLFALILALGMLVDNSIVVVENIYRWISRGFTKKQAARSATSEVAVPIIASTATTLAAFLPLIFWDSIMGKFMHLLPIVLIIVLTSSLFVALVIVPVFSEVFVKKEDGEKKTDKRKSLIIAGALLALSIPFYLTKIYGFANILMLAVIFILLGIFIFERIGKWFATSFLDWLDNIYERLVRFSLRGKMPYLFFAGTFVLLIFSLMLLKWRQPKVDFFPDSDPNYINMVVEMPVGTDIAATDKFMRETENEVNALLLPDKRIIKSVLTNVGKGVKSGNRFSGLQGSDNTGMITVTFIDFEDRGGISTSDIMQQMQNNFIGKYPGVKFTLEKDKKGPPTGNPINIELSGNEFNVLLTYSDSIIHIIDTAKIKGIEGLKIDLNVGQPEMLVHIDRDAARRFGLSTGQIAGQIRTALYGNKAGDFKVGEDKYPIQVRFEKKYRYSIPDLMNQKITFRNNRGKVMQIPISAVANFEYSTTYSSVKRKDLNRVVTIYSNIVQGYNANEVNTEIKSALANYKLPPGYEFNFTGEQQDQKDAMAFLSKAMMIALFLILLILVTQFNSIIKPVIILFSVLFSTIGVFGGLAILNMDLVIIMTGVGLVSLAGIVVNNAIVLIDYIELLKIKRRKELGLYENAFLPIEEATECVVQGGRTRLRPVLLTAITTILGLMPMVVKFNINFTTLLTEFDPQIFFGGDMANIWAPLATTVVLGLTFATFLTLIIVPVMYRIVTRIQKIFVDKKTLKLNPAKQ